MHILLHIHVQRYRYIDMHAHIDIYRYIYSQADVAQPATPARRTASKERFPRSSSQKNPAQRRYEHQAEASATLLIPPTPHPLKPQP